MTRTAGRPPYAPSARPSCGGRARGPRRALPPSSRAPSGCRAPYCEARSTRPGPAPAGRSWRDPRTAARARPGSNGAPTRRPRGGSGRRRRRRGEAWRARGTTRPRPSRAGVGVARPRAPPTRPPRPRAARSGRARAAAPATGVPRPPPVPCAARPSAASSSAPPPPRWALPRRFAEWAGWSRCRPARPGLHRPGERDPPASAGPGAGARRTPASGAGRPRATGRSTPAPPVARWRRRPPRTTPRRPRRP